jgi:endo-1,4-beta-xylanase
MNISRRQFLVGATALGSAGVMGSSRYGLAFGSSFAATDGESAWGMDAPLLTLKDAAYSSGVLVGCAVTAVDLDTIPEYAELVRAQANIVVAENAFNYGSVRPTLKAGYNFKAADAIAEYAHANNLKLRGHSLVWHQQLPAGFATVVTAHNAEAVMTTHIGVMAGRFAGHIHSWDVVNEAVAPEDGRADGLRKSVWLQLMGPGYIATAFRVARKEDPKALLFYNEGGIEGEDAASTKKREAVLSLLRGLLEKDVPIDGLGIQSHLTAGQTYGPGVRNLIQQAHAMGLRVMLTELDVDDRAYAPAADVRDEAVANTYSQYLKAALGDGYVTGVLTWGVTDKASWLNREKARPDGAAERPLPFDTQMNPKAAFVAQRRALSQAPRVVPVLRPRTQVLIETASVGMGRGR